MSHLTGSKSFWTAVGLLFCVIALQSLAISGDKPEFSRPVLSMTASFQTDESLKARMNPAGGAPLIGMREAEPLPPPEAPVPADLTVDQAAAVEPALPPPPPPPSSPASEGDEPQPSSTQVPAPQPAQPAVEDPSERVVTVGRGDSLWVIARRIGTTTLELMRLNGLTSPTIRAGDRLRVPGSTNGGSPAPRARRRQPRAPSSRSTTSPATPGLTYKVQPGDTLTAIAERYGVSVEDLMLENGILNGRTLAVGQVLRLKRSRTMIHKVAPGETLWTISRRYGVTVKQILEENPLNKLTIRPGQKLEVPVVGSAALSARPTGPAYLREAHKMRWRWPVRGRITDRFGMRVHPILRKRCFHCGIDIAGPTGRRVKAPLPGIVTFAGWLRGYGRTVVVKHKGNFTTRYAHLSRVLVSSGDVLKPGKVVGLSGNSGTSTGPHLHFEVRYDGRPVDPWTILKDVG